MEFKKLMGALKPRHFIFLLERLPINKLFLCLFDQWTKTNVQVSTYQIGIKASRKKSTNYKNNQKAKKQTCTISMCIYVRSRDHYIDTTYICTKSEQTSRTWAGLGSPKAETQCQA